MSNRILLIICDYFTSEEWWRPICGFLSTNCAKFDEESNTFEQFQTFVQFQHLISDIFDSSLSKRLNMRPINLETSFFQEYANGQFQIKAIIIIINNLLDYKEFKRIMCETSKSIEEDTTNAMEEFRKQSAENGDDGAAGNVVEMLEKCEVRFLHRRTVEMCEKTKEYINYSQIIMSQTLPQKHISNLLPPQNVSTPLNFGMKAPLGNSMHLAPLMTNVRSSQNSLGARHAKPMIMKPTGVSKLRNSKLGPLK